MVKGVFWGSDDSLCLSVLVFWVRFLYVAISDLEVYCRLRNVCFERYMMTSRLGMLLGM